MLRPRGFLGEDLETRPREGRKDRQTGISYRDTVSLSQQLYICSQVSDLQRYSTHLLNSLVQ